MKLQVLGVTPRSGVSKNGKPYSFQVCKAVFTGNDGVIEVGEVVLFDETQTIQPGDYVPEFEVKRDAAGRLQGHISRLVPVIKKNAT